MNNLYLRKLTATQAHGNQIDIPKTIAISFFEVSQDLIDQVENETINVCHRSNLTKFEQIEIQGATNPRFSTKLNTFLANNGDELEENDLLIVEKLGRSYSVGIIKKKTTNYAALEELFDEGEKHMLLTANSDDLESEQKNNDISLPLQQIFYGAPGTGKSHGVKEVTDSIAKEFVFRTTFHPDSDYSTFVGAYKPTMKQLPIFNQQTGAQIGVEDKIVYSFVPQAFLKAYVAAWKNQDQPVFLVIEEINRGNCAQIFGDIFQLLDRNDNGQSEYPIKADQDIRDHLAKEFADVEGLEDNIQSGAELMLPSNLHIWATMNTSDQSLFPIDSAFKRRWDWKYVPIVDAGKNWKIKAGETTYDLWKFIEAINEQINITTSSEDKKLGYFFCKPCEGDNILATKFVNKVVFYLWNDVFKDYELPNAFKKADGHGHMSFNDFYTKQDECILQLMKNLKVQPDGQAEESEVIEELTEEIEA